MKRFHFVLIAVAIALIIFNATKLDFNNLFEGDSAVAAICIMAAACVIVLLLILRISKKIEQKERKKTIV
jgi:hypothetical protein